MADPIGVGHTLLQCPCEQVQAAMLGNQRWDWGEGVTCIMNISSHGS